MMNNDALDGDDEAGLEKEEEEERDNVRFTFDIAMPVSPFERLQVGKHANAHANAHAAKANQGPEGRRSSHHLCISGGATGRQAAITNNMQTESRFSKSPMKVPMKLSFDQAAFGSPTTATHHPNQQSPMLTSHHQLNASNHPQCNQQAMQLADAFEESVHAIFSPTNDCWEAWGETKEGRLAADDNHGDDVLPMADAIDPEPMIPDEGGDLERTIDLIELQHCGKERCPDEGSTAMQTEDDLMGLVSDYVDEEELQYATELKETLALLPGGSSETKGLGKWGIKRRKRYYVSLSGKVYYGADAIRMANRDRARSKTQSRAELQHLMASRSANSLLTLPDDEVCLLKNWGLPADTVRKYARLLSPRNAREIVVEPQLFRWQAECLLSNGGSALSGGDLIYTAPTSGGKTLVSEILMLRRLALVPNGTILFVVPFVALAEEKTAYFRSTWDGMHIGVVGFHGGDGDDSSAVSCLTSDIDVAVCTIEKANALLNQLLEEKNEGKLSMIVIDEIHMLSDPSRGFLLEVILSKIKYLNSQILPDGRKVMNTQVVGMSATLPGIEDMATWLRAALYKTTFRPVSLSLRVACGHALYAVNKPQMIDSDLHLPSPNARTMTPDLLLTRVRQIEPVPSTDRSGTCGTTSPMHAIAATMQALVFETLAENKSVMVFCGTKDLCKQYASQLTAQWARLTGYQLPDSAKIARQLLLKNLMKCPVGICETLERTIPMGIAYHNASLSMDEKLLLETAYKDGTLCVLCCTGTLSAGVNLPAHRVIISGTMVGKNIPISVTSFRQMCGRAGRMGLDSEGEAILMVSDQSSATLTIVNHLFNDDMESLQTSLDVSKGGGLEKLLLDMISSEKIDHESQIAGYVSHTLLSVQKPTEIQACTAKSLQFLKSNDFLERRDDTRLRCTLVGKATTKSGLSPHEVVDMLPALTRAHRERLLLLGDGLHLLFLVTPLQASFEPNWKNYERLVRTLYSENPETTVVAEFLGIEYGDLVHFMTNPPTRGSTDKKRDLPLYRRFNAAIVLSSLIQERPISHVLEMMRDDEWNGKSSAASIDQRGNLQSFQKEASRFCRSVVNFCETLNYDLLASCLSVYAERLSYGVRDELIPLVRLGREMPQIRAREFYKRGITCPVDIVNAGLIGVEQILLATLSFNARALHSTGTGNDVMEKESCKRLAKKLILRAQEQINRELALLS